MEASLSEETIYNLFYSHNAYNFDGQLSLIVASQHEDGLLLFLFWIVFVLFFGYLEIWNSREKLIYASLLI